MIDTGGILRWVSFFEDYQAQTLSCTGGGELAMEQYRSGCGRTDQRIPRASAQTDAIIADTQTAHTVVVAAQRANLVAAKNIPNLRQSAQDLTSHWNSETEVPCTRNRRILRRVTDRRRRMRPK